MLYLSSVGPLAFRSVFCLSCEEFCGIFLSALEKSWWHVCFVPVYLRLVVFQSCGLTAPCVCFSISFLVSAVFLTSFFYLTVIFIDLTCILLRKPFYHLNYFCSFYLVNRIMILWIFFDTLTPVVLG